MTLYRIAIALLVISFSTISIVTAQPNTLTVPFQNLYLAPNQSINAADTIGDHRMIFCFANNTENAGSVSWPYKGTRPASHLPVLLKTDSHLEGQFADNSGTITIQNTTSTQLETGCVFGY